VELHAQVTRDNAIRDWEFEPNLADTSREMGSGYPSGARRGGLPHEQNETEEDFLILTIG
jgi:hypothetical protein